MPFRVVAIWLSGEGQGKQNTHTQLFVCHRCQASWPMPRKAGVELEWNFRTFKEKWTNDYFTSQCSWLGEKMHLRKRINPERHHRDKCAWIKLTLYGRFWLTSEQISQDFWQRQRYAGNFCGGQINSWEAETLFRGNISEIECLVAAAELLSPDKENCSKVSVGLTRTITDYWWHDIGKKNIEGQCEKCLVFFFFSGDETTNITNATQPAIFVCGITAVFDTREELCSLYAVHTTAKDEDSCFFSFGQIKKTVPDITVEGFVWYMCSII